MLDRSLGELVRGATVGDPVAVDALLERHLPQVRAYLRLRAGGLLLDKESVSDLAQSVCRDVLEQLDRFRYDGEDGFRRWLFKTAERKVCDRWEYYRAKKRDADLEVAGDGDFEKSLQCYGTMMTPSRHAIAREELERIESALAELPDEQREIVILAKVVGLSRRAIADQLGKSEGAVRVQLFRALAWLGDRLVD